MGLESVIIISQLGNPTVIFLSLIYDIVSVQLQKFI